MNTQQARARVAETFPQPFNKGKFLEFSRNLLNKFDESKAQAWNSQYVKDAFKDHVSRFERLGTYTSPDHEKLDVLIVHLTNESKLERARTAIRNFVADHLRQRDGKDAALVAFVSPTERQWRFSYVKMEYAAVETEAGKVGVETRLTPARRFSYIVGEGESCHTAQTRFLALLQDTENYPKLEQLEEAFSVEAVTKEFFNQYAALFGEIEAALQKLAAKDPDIGKEFKAKNVSTVDFAKKLMGQIVFLYFLQKKGWLGVPKGQDWGTGPHDFLRRLVSSSPLPSDGRGVRGEGAVNIFNDVLEPLFYDSLATDRGHEAWCNHFKCRIPFLNGGLFEPLADYDWRKTDILFPNKLFTNTERNDAGDIGTGVLDVFDRYNFTVNEAEPLEKEVAIDPEMLGKVFENLIEENRRKGLGSYYTPREIVHYMCQESLINYLDSALNTGSSEMGSARAPRAAVGAPADGSASVAAEGLREGAQTDTRGACAPRIPRADLETFVHLGDQISHYEAVETRYAIKMPASITEHARLMDEKLADITVCDPAVGSGAFPVGMMTEIVRARSALTPYLNDPHERSPYFFKRHAIQNCLYGVDIDPSAVEIAKLRLWLSLVVDEEDVKQIKPLPNLFYKIVTGNSLLGVEKNLFNQQLFQKLEKLKPLYFDQSDQSKKSALRRQIEDTIHELTNGKEAFDFEIYFSEVFHRKGGFDVLIANPPYVRQEKIKELKPALKAFGYECYNGTADLLVYFYERGVKLLRPGGAIALITSNKYYRAGYGENLRGFLARQLTLNRLIDFGDAPVFEAIAYASILTGVRNAPAPDASALGYTWEKEMTFERITQIVRERGQQIPQNELKPDGWRLESPTVFRFLEKLRHTGKPLGEYVDGKFYRGVVTGLNQAFVIDRATRDLMVKEDKKTAQILKPFLLGRHVRKWKAEFPDFYVLFIVWDFPIEKYPAVLKHLKQFETQLKARPEVKEGRFPWFALSRYGSDFWQEFETLKIIYPDIYEHQSFAWDESNSFLGNTAYFIPTKEKWMIGLLNSNTVGWFYSLISNKVRGGYLRAFSPYMEQIPIPTVGSEKQKEVEKLVDRILAAKQRDAGADTSALEHEIDELVYALYGLTPEEIKIVRDASK